MKFPMMLKPFKQPYAPMLMGARVGVSFISLLGRSTASSRMLALEFVGLQQPRRERCLVWLSGEPLPTTKGLLVVAMHLRG